MTPPLTLRVRSVWILLAAVASLLVAAGYGLLTAIQLIQAPQFLDDLGLNGFAARTALVMQFIGPVPPLLLLLAVMLLAGCLVLTERVPVPPRPTVGGGAQPIGGRRLQLGLLGLAALAGLSALTYAAAGALALTADFTPTEDTPLQLLNLSNSVTVLAVSLATLGLLAAVLLSWRVLGHLPTSPGVPDEQSDAASDLGPASKSAEAKAPQTPLSSSPDLIESRQPVTRGRQRRPQA